jgi:hypothetical protein
VPMCKTGRNCPNECGTFLKAPPVVVSNSIQQQQVVPKIGDHTPWDSYDRAIYRGMDTGFTESSRYAAYVRIGRSARIPTKPLGRE